MIQYSGGGPATGRNAAYFAPDVTEPVAPALHSMKGNISYESIGN